MSYSYEYDKSGLASSYLALSFLIPITLFYSYFFLSRKQQKQLDCKICSKKRKGSFLKGFILFILLCLVSYFISNIRTIKMDIKKDFDPLEILGISLDASKKVIKKRMQTLLIKYSVHKAPDDKKKEYEEKCMDISKAYNIVRNKDSFNSWLNTESKSGEIMAIPEIVMKNAFTAFLIYCLILIIGLPLYTFRKWKIMKNRNRLNVHFKSMEEFIKYFNEDLRKRGDVRSLIWILSRSVEFRSTNVYECALSKGEHKTGKTKEHHNTNILKEHHTTNILKEQKEEHHNTNILKEHHNTNILKEHHNTNILKEHHNTNILKEHHNTNILKEHHNTNILKDKIGEDFGYPLPDLKSNGSYFFYDFLFRTNLTNSYEKRKIIKNSLNLVECMKLIALNKGYIDILKDIFTLQGMITQAVFDDEYYLLQFPFVEFKDLFILKIKKGNKLQTKEALKCLLDSSKLEEAERLLKAIPRVEIEKFIATVKGTGMNIGENDNDDNEGKNIDHEDGKNIDHEDGKNKDHEDGKNHIDGKNHTDGKDSLNKSKLKNNIKNNSKSNLCQNSSIVNTFDIPKNSLVTIKIRLNTTNSRVGVHTHFIDIPFEHSWTAFISIDNNLHKKFTKINKNQEKISFEFDAPKNKKVSEVKLFLLDGFYLRNNVEESILIKYV